MARAAAIKRQEALWKAFQKKSFQMSAAQRAYKDGDINVAARLLISLTRSRPVTVVNAQAKRGLNDLAEEARKKVAAIDATLERNSQALSAGVIVSPLDWPDGWQEEGQQKLLSLSALAIGQMRRQDHHGSPLEAEQSL